MFSALRASCRLAGAQHACVGPHSVQNAVLGSARRWERGNLELQSYKGWSVALPVRRGWQDEGGLWPSKLLHSWLPGWHAPQQGIGAQQCAPLVLLVEGLALAARQRRPDLLLVLLRQGLAPGAVAAPDLAPRGLHQPRVRAAPGPLLAHRARLQRATLHGRVPNWSVKAGHQDLSVPVKAQLPPRL